MFNAYGQVIAHNHMDKKYPSEVNFSKSEIKEIVLKLKEKKWWELPSKWIGKDGGAGEYIQEEHFHVKVNPEKRGDLGDYELKTTRSRHTGLISLSRMDAKDKSISESLLHKLLLDYGYPYKKGNTSEFFCRDAKAKKPTDKIGPEHKKHLGQIKNYGPYPNDQCFPDDELSLHTDLCGEIGESSTKSRLGLYLEINREKKIVRPRFDSSRCKNNPKNIKKPDAKDVNYPQWLESIKARHDGFPDIDEKFSISFERIEKAANEKFGQMVVIKYLENEKKDSISVDEAYFLEDYNFENFLTALGVGKIYYEYSMHGNKNYMTKNHGTGFRMHEKDFSYVYGKKEEI